MSIKVRAKFKGAHFGFYAGLTRRNGDVFFINDENEFSKNWMEKVGENVKPTPAPKPGAAMPFPFRADPEVEAAKTSSKGKRSEGAL